jgi:pantetheine-phosphate adenylyltransferase
MCGEPSSESLGQPPGAERIAVYPGSFDPLTNGHVDIIMRGVRIFDRIIVAILLNQEKVPLFSVEERVATAREVYRRQARVEVDTFDGLLVDYARRRGACDRAGTAGDLDFEYEFQMALMNDGSCRISRPCL